MNQSFNKKELLNTYGPQKLVVSSDFIGQNKLLKVKDVGVSPIIPYGMFYKKT